MPQWDPNVRWLNHREMVEFGVLHPSCCHTHIPLTNFRVRTDVAQGNQAHCIIGLEALIFNFNAI